MKNQFDTLLEGQKKMMDFWSDAAQKMTASITPPTAKNTSQDYLSQWMDMQKKVWEEAMKVGNLQKSFEHAPEQLEQWAKMQTEMAQQWMNFYTQNAEKFGVKVPPVNGFSKTAATNPFMPPQWNEVMNQSNKWINDSLKNILPFPQDFHFDKFGEIYSELYKFWQPLQKMMEYGITKWEGIGQYFSPEIHKELVGKMVGFKPVHNVQEMIQQANSFFDQYVEWLQKQTPDPKDYMTHWQDLSQHFAPGSTHPSMRTIMEVSETLRSGVDSLFHVSGQYREVEMARKLKDIQFAYLAFILKSTEMQSIIFQAGQFAMPDTLEHFYTEYKKTRQLPDYQAFFGQYINDLEKYILDVLDSKEYSLLQSEVANSGILVKSQIDHLIEFAFADMPFLTNSFADEVATETSTLRKKVRVLEARLSELESHLVNSNGKAQKGESVKTVVKAKSVAPHPAKTRKSDLLDFIGKASAKEKDDLKTISGIGPKLETMLNDLGIFTFRQIAKLNKKHYEMIDELLGAFQGRAERDDWAGQAKKLLK